MVSVNAKMSVISVNTAAQAGLSRTTYAPGTEILAPLHSGGVSRTLVAKSSGTPSLEIETMGVYAWLALLASSGPLPYLTLTEFSWIDILNASLAPTDEAGSVHEKKAATSGILTFSSLSVTPRQPATMNLRAQFVSSTSATNPISESQVAAPSAPGVLAAMTMDSLTLDGTAYEEITGVDISCATDFMVRRGVGPYPTYIHPSFVDWTMTIRHENPAISRVKGDKAANCSLVLKPWQTGSAALGSATQTWTITGMVHQDASTRSTEGSVEHTTIVRGRYDGSIQPATWANA